VNDIEIAVSVLAVVALPLAGIGPVLLRTLPAAVVAAGMVGGAGIVMLLTHEPWAAAFTLCVGAAVLLRHWRARRGQAGSRSAAPRTSPVPAGLASAPSEGAESDLA
jgi:hypothetical protein